MPGLFKNKMPPKIIYNALCFLTRMVIRFIILFHDDHFLMQSCLLTFSKQLTFRKINFEIDFTASILQLKFTRYAACNAAQINSFSHKIFTDNFSLYENRRA